MNKRAISLGAACALCLFLLPVFIAMGQKSRKFYEKASASLQAKDSIAARNFLQKSLAADSSYLPTLLLLAKTESRTERCIYWINKALQQKLDASQQRDLLKQKGLLYYSIANFSEAASALAAALALGETSDDLKLALADSHVQNNQFSKGIDLYKELLPRAKELANKGVFLHLRLGILYERQEQWHLAYKTFGEGLMLSPDNSGTTLGRARCAFQFGLYNEALELFEKGLLAEKEPAYRSHHLLLMAKCNWELKKVKPALSLCNRAIELNPNNLEAFRFCAFLLIHAKEYKLAKLQYDELLRLSGSSSTYLSDYFALRAFCYAQLGMLVEANKDLAKAAGYEPKWGQTYARYYPYVEWQERGEFKAQTAADSALLPSFYLGRGRLFLDYSEFKDQGERDLRKSLELSKKTEVSYPFALFFSGKVDSAIVFYSAQVLKPKFSTADNGVDLYNLACLYSLNRNNKEALLYLKKATEAGYKNNRLLFADEDLFFLRRCPEFVEFAKKEKLSHSDLLASTYERVRQRTRLYLSNWLKRKSSENLDLYEIRVLSADSVCKAYSREAWLFWEQYLKRNTDWTSFTIQEKDKAAKRLNVVFSGLYSLDFVVETEEMELFKQALEKQQFLALELGYDEQGDFIQKLKLGTPTKSWTSLETDRKGLESLGLKQSGVHVPVILRKQAALD